MYIAKPENIDGDIFFELSLLVEAGLLSDYSNSTSLTLTVYDDGFVYIRSLQKVLRGKLKRSDKVQVPIVALTRAGRELVRILDCGDGTDALLDFSSRAKKYIEYVEIGDAVAPNTARNFSKI